ncbi:MAG TPA: hypothetical protein VGL86_04875 [Polyangia bacterium]|jgi:hypothetical protein
MRRAFVAVLLFVVGCPSGDDGGRSKDLAAIAGDDMETSSGALDLAVPTAPNGGTMEVLSTPMSWSGGASFYTGMPATTSPECSYTSVGACTAAQCTIGTADGGTAAPTSTLVSAGDVAVAVGSMAPIAFAVEPGDYYLAPGSNAQALFNGGEVITFTASGAVAPASSTMVQAPSPPTLTMPSQPPLYTISRSSDFAFAWTGGGPGQFVVAVQTSPSSIAPGTQFGSVSCTFAVSAGSGAIPSAALAVLPAGNAMLTFAVANQAINVVGDWAFTARVGTYLETTGGQPIAGGQATIN